MKRQFSESAFRRWLDSVNPKGIQIEETWYKDARDLQEKSSTTFRTMYNDWIEANERELGHNATGCYN